MGLTRLGVMKVSSSRWLPGLHVILCEKTFCKQHIVWAGAPGVGLVAWSDGQEAAWASYSGSKAGHREDCLCVLNYPRHSAASVSSPADREHVICVSGRLGARVRVPGMA